MLLIILSAIAIIFFAVSLNWGRVSQIKNITTIGATTTAAMMASNYASWAELQRETTLGGRWEYCKHNSVWGAILTLIIVIIIVVACAYSAGAACGAFAGGTAAGGGAITAAGWVAIGMAAASVALQATVVQPGITRMWNRLQADAGLSVAESFLTNGLSGAMQGSSSDTVMITDYYDSNTNGKYGAVGGVANDQISRFSFFMTEYFRGIKSTRAAIDLTAFWNGLKNFLPNITIPNAEVGSADPRYNPCCLPLEYNGEALRPDDTTCPDRDPVPAACNGALWSGAPDFYGNTYPLAFDPFRPNYLACPGNSSFLAKLGIDEEVRNFDPFPYIINKPPLLPVPNKLNETTNLFRGFWDMGHIKDTVVFPSLILPAAVDVNLPKRVMDKVVEITNYKAPDDFCANAGTGGLYAPESGINWKPAKDSYCERHPSWPYDLCTKFNCGADDCCSAAGGMPADAWPEDQIDDTIDQLKIFYRWGQKLLQNTPAELAQTLDTWYASGGDSNAAYWLGPKCDGTNANVCSDGPDGGFLYTIKRRLTAWDSYLKPWLNDNLFADNGAWCVPSDAAGLSVKEVSEITSGGSVWGSIGSVINCLRWYSDNDASFGAHYYFKRCQDRIDKIKEDATKASKYKACQDDFANVIKAQTFATCQKDINTAIFNAQVAAEYQTCQASIVMAKGTPGYCASGNTDRVCGTFGGINSGCGVEPAYVACSAAYDAWVACNLAAFGPTIWPACPPQPASCFFPPLADNTGMPGYDGCVAGGAFRTWLTSRISAYGGITVDSIHDTGTMPPTCSALPASTIAPIPDPGTDPAGYAAWLAASRATFNGGITREQYCGPPLPAPPDPECNAAQTFPRSLYGNPPVYDVCTNDTTWTTHSGNYQTWLDNSMDGNEKYQMNGVDLVNDPAPFRTRYLFLKSIRDNIKTGTDAIESFNTKLQAFLVGPVASLIAAKASSNSAVIDSVPNTMIYGWQDENPPSSARPGYWHVIRAKVILPANLPSVGTKRKGFLGSTRCYFLKDYEDRVKVEVTRWDEDHDAIKFRNKLPIWTVNFRKPGTAKQASPAAACFGKNIGISTSPPTMAQLGAVWGADIRTQDMIKGAFLIAGTATSGDAAICYNHIVDDLMPQGTTTTMCAHYGKDNRTDAMGVYFEPCP